MLSESLHSVFLNIFRNFVRVKVVQVKLSNLLWEELNELLWMFAAFKTRLNDSRHAVCAAFIFCFLSGAFKMEQHTIPSLGGTEHDWFPLMLSGKPAAPSFSFCCEVVSLWGDFWICCFNCMFCTKKTETVLKLAFFYFHLTAPTIVFYREFPSNLVQLGLKIKV